VLFLGEGTSSSTCPSWLIDATGRKVTALRPGANDVSRLSPGVYFVRSAVSVRKVILGR